MPYDAGSSALGGVKRPVNKKAQNWRQARAAGIKPGTAIRDDTGKVTGGTPIKPATTPPSKPAVPGAAGGTITPGAPTGTAGPTAGPRPGRRPPNMTNPGGPAGGPGEAGKADIVDPRMASKPGMPPSGGIYASDAHTPGMGRPVPGVDYPGPFNPFNPGGGAPDWLPPMSGGADPNGSVSNDPMQGAFPMPNYPGVTTQAFGPGGINGTFGVLSQDGMVGPGGKIIGRDPRTNQFPGLGDAQGNTWLGPVAGDPTRNLTPGQWNPNGFGGQSVVGGVRGAFGDPFQSTQPMPMLGQNPFFGPGGFGGQFPGMNNPDSPFGPGAGFSKGPWNDPGTAMPTFRPGDPGYPTPGGGSSGFDGGSMGSMGAGSGGGRVPMTPRPRGAGGPQAPAQGGTGREIGNQNPAVYPSPGRKKKQVQVNRP